MYSINGSYYKTTYLITYILSSPQGNEGMCSHMKDTYTSVYLSLRGPSNDVTCHNKNLCPNTAQTCDIEYRLDNRGRIFTIYFTCDLLI